MSLRISAFPWRSFAGGVGIRGSNALPPSTSIRSVSPGSFPCRRAASFSSPRNSAQLGEVPLAGVEDELVGYIFGKKKVTDVAHSVWEHVVRRGDTVVDATCGNGYDTLAMLRLVADSSGRGRVFGIDIQEEAIANTDLLLSQSLNPNEKELVKLFPMCHSKMEEVIPKDVSVRLVAFNLGYLPGGDKEIATVSETTFLALEAAAKIVKPGGLISAVVYVGHPQGREEFDAVQAFASKLSTEDWVCCKLQMLNRPLAPIPIFMFKK